MKKGMSLKSRARPWDNTNYMVRKKSRNETANAVSSFLRRRRSVISGIKGLDFANLSAAVTKEAARDERGRTRKEIGGRTAARL